MFRDIQNCLFLVYRLYRIYLDESDENVDRLKRAAYACGAIGVKLLQFLVVRDGFMTTSCQKKFGDVFEDCETHPWEETCRMYREDFGRELEEDYEAIEDQITIVGAGSIGQVYRLRERESGRVVAMKVKHPHVDRTTRAFVWNIRAVLRGVEWVVRVPFVSLLYDFMDNVRSQLDYSQEVENTRRLRECFASERAVIIPEVYKHSTHFIVMSYHEGSSIYQIQDKRLLRNIYMDVYFFTASSILVHDFLHCDLHPGNWKVQLSPENPMDYKLIVYDCGIMGSTNDRILNEKIMYSIYGAQYTQLIEVVVPDLDEQRGGTVVRALAKELDKRDGPTKKDRFSCLVRETLRNGVELDQNILRYVQGLILCSDTLLSSMDRFCKLLNNDQKEVIFFYLKGVLERTGKYQGYLEVLKDWIAREPGATGAFLDWLDDNFGHRDESVFHEIIWRAYEMGDMHPVS